MLITFEQSSIMEQDEYTKKALFKSLFRGKGREEPVDPTSNNPEDKRRIISSKWLPPLKVRQQRPEQMKKPNGRSKARLAPDEEYEKTELKSRFPIHEISKSNDQRRHLKHNLNARFTQKYLLHQKNEFDLDFVQEEKVKVKKSMYDPSWILHLGDNDCLRVKNHENNDLAVDLNVSNQTYSLEKENGTIHDSRNDSKSPSHLDLSCLTSISPVNASAQWNPHISLRRSDTHGLKPLISDNQRAFADRLKVKLNLFYEPDGPPLAFKPLYPAVKEYIYGLHSAITGNIESIDEFVKPSKDLGSIAIALRNHKLETSADHALYGICDWDKGYHTYGESSDSRKVSVETKKTTNQDSSKSRPTSRMAMNLKNRSSSAMQNQIEYTNAETFLDRMKESFDEARQKYQKELLFKLDMRRRIRRALCEDDASLTGLKESVNSDLQKAFELGKSKPSFSWEGAAVQIIGPEFPKLVMEKTGGDKTQHNLALMKTGTVNDYLPKVQTINSQPKIRLVDPSPHPSEPLKLPSL